MGDLAELYRSPGQYLCCALEALPGVIAGQVRRTTDLPRLILVGLMLFGALEAPGEPWPAAAIPALLALATLVLRRAYALKVAPLSFGAALRQARLDVVTVAAAVLGFQALAALLAPQWLLPPGARFVAFPIFCVLFFVLRLQSPGGAWPPPTARPLSGEELLLEARGIAASCRRAMRIELGAVLAFMLISAGMLLAASTPLARIGSALSIAGMLLAGRYLLRQARQLHRADSLDLTGCASAAGCAAVYRRWLEQRHQAGDSYLWAYVLPLMAGPIAMLTEAALQRPAPWGALLRAAAALAVVAALLVWMNQSGRARLQRRIDQLSTTQQS
jgi:hypothetical protein